jgi:integrase
MRGTVRGILVYESTGTSNRRAAEEIRAKREAELLHESIHGRRITVTFAEGAASYIEKGGSSRFLERIIRHFGTLPLNRIDQDALDRGARKLFPNASPATRNRQFYTPASAVLWHSSRRGWCPAPVIERPPASALPVPRWLTIDEANRLIAACAPHLRPLVLFMLYTGARAGEALWLDWACVDLSRAHVTFPKTKNGVPRGVPLHPRVIAALEKLPYRVGPVFRRPNGFSYIRPTAPTNTSAGSQIKTGFKAACRRAGIADFRVHDCRHTWATWHYAANRDLGALQRLGGWKSISMVMRYTHVNVSELAPTINRLPGADSGESETSNAGNPLETNG